jgi:hypothetical protein
MAQILIHTGSKLSNASSIEPFHKWRGLAELHVLCPRCLTTEVSMKRKTESAKSLKARGAKAAGKSRYGQQSYGQGGYGHQGPIPAGDDPALYGDGVSASKGIKGSGGTRQKRKQATQD